MKRRVIISLAASSLLVIASETPSQAQSPPAEQQAEASDQIEEIVVTARRMQESLQDVPQTVVAVTSAEVEKFNLLQLQDIDKVVSGINIQGGQISTRGVVLQVAAATPQPTTATYLNDAPVVSSGLVQSMFDIGQIEVERGPQGTLRGISTPSGALAVTTRRPNLEEIGGTAQVTVTDLNAHNLQGALNLPLLQDKLAVRVAVLQDDNAGSDVRSINSAALPDSRTAAARVSLRFEPIDTISANVMYQYLEDRIVSFGAGGFNGLYTPNPSAPVGYNGPVISPYSREAVVANPIVPTNRVEYLTGDFGWSVFGQRLTFVGSTQKFETPVLTIGDPMNLLKGYLLSGGDFPVTEKTNTYEFRVSSEDRILRIFNYTLGIFHEGDSVNTKGDNGPAQFLPGAFGAPGTTLTPGPVNPRYQLDTLINTPRDIDETSFFADVIVHVTDKLEIEGGGRYIHSELDSTLGIKTTPSFAAVALPQAFCTAVGGQFGVGYPGICDFPIPSQNIVVPGGGQHTTSEPWIYKASISYHFTQDLMSYFTTGTSWRQGTPGIGLNIAPSTANDLLPYFNHANETSTSYEVGAKWSFLDHRARLNVDYFHQVYDNYIYGVPGLIYYLNAVPTPPVVSQNPFYASVPATVDGADLDFAMNLTKHWNVSTAFSYADGRVSKTGIPCNDSNFDGVPDNGVPTVAGFLKSGVAVAKCQLSPASSTQPKWNANLQSEYFTPITDSVDAFLRGNLVYNPSNPNNSQIYVTPAYALLDLFLGVRSPDQKWEVSVFGKNITDTNKILNQGPLLSPPANFVQVFPTTVYTQYAGVTLTPPREFGLIVRYSFGSG